MKAVILLLLLCTGTAFAGERDGHLVLIKRAYKATLLNAAAAAQSAGSDPLAEAKTPEQRRFLVAYYEVMAQGGPRVRDLRYPYMEALRRCGVYFPEGASVAWLPFSTPISVTHTAGGQKVISRYMGLSAE